jgi:uncharacterized protein with PIN domain
MNCPTCKNPVWRDKEENIIINLNDLTATSDRYYKCYQCNSLYIYKDGKLAGELGLNEGS